jgi:hypothetical protein
MLQICLLIYDCKTFIVQVTDHTSRMCQFTLAKCTVTTTASELEYELVTLYDATQIRSKFYLCRFVSYEVAKKSQVQLCHCSFRQYKRRFMPCLHV